MVEVASVWDALADTPAEAANLQARADLMRRIQQVVADSGWGTSEAARQCGLTEPRCQELMQGRISQFTLDALIGIVTALGYRVRVEMDAA